MSSAIHPLAPLPSVHLPREAWSDRFLTGVGSALDSGVMQAMQIVVERALIPDAADVNALRESARAMLDPLLQAEPQRFFEYLDEEPHNLRMHSRFRRRIGGGAVYDCRIESDYVAYGEAGPAASGSPIHVELWHHERGRPRGTIVALHGFTMGRPRVDAMMLMANHWFARGLDVVLFTLPYHGARTPADARFSGEHFAVPDVSRLSEAVREAIYEIRQVMHWRREETGAPVGVLGLSLGGYLAALAAGLCDDVDFAIPMVPPVCIGDLAWRFFTGTRHHREGGEAALSHDELRRAFRVHSPLSHPLRIPQERVLIVAGRGDRIVPPEHPEALRAHWGGAAIHWFSGSHLAPFGRRQIARKIDRHLRSIGVL
jgi:pimeloyl-ACP methyl ester carboxylesterase